MACATTVPRSAGMTTACTPPMGGRWGVFGLGAVKRTARGDRMWKTWIERTAAQVRDLDIYAVLDRR